MPTLLDIQGLKPNGHVTGNSLLPLLFGAETSGQRDCLFGIFGGAINATDGHYGYFRYPEDMETTDLFEYTLMPCITAACLR